MKTRMKLFALAVPVLFAAACGGETCDPVTGLGCTNNDMADSGKDMADVGKDMADVGPCSAGTTLFRLQNGLYNTTAVSGIQDGCNLGLNATVLSSQRNVVNDVTMGTVTITSQDGSTILGTGPVKCNTGVLTYGPTVLQSGACRYESTRTSNFVLSADNTFALQFTEARSKFSSVPGMNCTIVAPCNIAFTLTMSKPVQ